MTKQEKIENLKEHAVNTIVLSGMFLIMGFFGLVGNTAGLMVEAVKIALGIDDE